MAPRAVLEELAAKTLGGLGAGENDSDRRSDDTLLELARRTNCSGSFPPNRGDFWYDRRLISLNTRAEEE